MQRPGAAERDEREVPRVVAALDRDDAERAQHLGVRRPPRRRPDRGRRAPARRPPRSSSSPPASRVGQPPEQEVRVGHRRPRAAAPVARRPGSAPALSGPDPQGAARVAPGDRAAARADGVQVDRRQADRAARRPSRSADALGLAAVDQADVRRRAAHVERDRVLEAGRARDRGAAPTTPAAGPGHERERRVRRRLRRASRRRRRSASRAARAGRLARTPAERTEVARDRPARGTRRPPSSRRARTRGTPARPRGTRRRAPRAAAAAARPRPPARGPGSRNEKSRQTATASASSSGSESRSSGSSTPSGPIRSRTPTQRSSGTSGSGCSAQSR